MKQAAAVSAALALFVGGLLTACGGRGAKAPPTDTVITLQTGQLSVTVYNK